MKKLFMFAGVFVLGFVTGLYAVSVSQGICCKAGLQSGNENILRAIQAGACNPAC